MEKEPSRFAQTAGYFFDRQINKQAEGIRQNT